MQAFIDLRASKLYRLTNAVKNYKELHNGVCKVHVGSKDACVPSKDWSAKG